MDARLNHLFPHIIWPLDRMIRCTSLDQRLQVLIPSGESILMVTLMCSSKGWDVRRDSRLIATGTCMSRQRCVGGAALFVSRRMAGGEMVVAGVNLVGLAFSAREIWQLFRSIQSIVCRRNQGNPSAVRFRLCNT